MIKVYTLIISMLVISVLTSCSHSPLTDISASSAFTSIPENTSPVTTPDETIEPTPTPPLVPEYEVELVAKVLRGECYDDQPDDKREVVKVICNRVCTGWFGDSVEVVITAPRQFQGYRPGNEPTANDYEIAREVLTEWYESGCQPMGKYLFFSSGCNHSNVFRENY